VDSGHVGLDHARSHEEALSLMETTAYAVALCDYKSGDGMALGLLRKVRAGHGRSLNLP